MKAEYSIRKAKRQGKKMDAIGNGNFGHLLKNQNRLFLKIIIQQFVLMRRKLRKALKEIFQLYARNGKTRIVS